MLFASDSSGSGSSNPILRAFKLEADTQGTITAAGGENSSVGAEATGNQHKKSKSASASRSDGLLCMLVTVLFSLGACGVPDRTVDFKKIVTKKGKVTSKGEAATEEDCGSDDHACSRCGDTTGRRTRGSCRTLQPWLFYVQRAGPRSIGTGASYPKYT
jgi:hypothetical protein